MTGLNNFVDKKLFYINIHWISGVREFFLLFSDDQDVAEAFMEFKVTCNTCLLLSELGCILWFSWNGFPLANKIVDMCLRFLHRFHNFS